MEEVDKITYLGQIITNDAKNSKNIKQRTSKGMGIIGEIFDILESLYLGPFYFEVALMLRHSILVNSMIFSTESWHNVSNSEVKELEAVDITFLCKLLEVPRSIPQEALYLELGIENNWQYDEMKKSFKFFRYPFMKEERVPAIFR